MTAPVQITVKISPESVKVGQPPVDSITVIHNTADAISIAQGPSGPTGPAGPSGPTGPTGPQGPSGAAVTSYVHAQASPSASWVVTHNLGMYPNVLVVDSAASVVEGEIVYNSVNQLTLTFAAAFSGSAYLS